MPSVLEPSVPSSADKLNILVVDDNRDNHVAVSAALSALGENIVCVESGTRALRLMLDQDFAFVLLDVQMPGMDGFEVARLMRQIERLRRTPIIFLSATRHDDSDLFAGYSAGAVDYISTPVNPALLRMKVSVFAEQCRSQRVEQQHLADIRKANSELADAIRERCRIEGELQDSQRLLEQQNAQIAAASQYKSEFLSSMAHELRTPLNVILGFAGTLLMKLPGPLNEEQTEQLGAIRTSGQLLLSLVNDLLDLGRIEAGKVSMTPEDLSCRTVLDEIASSLAPMAAAKGLALNVTSPQSIVVRTDRRALTQVLLNLTNNAIKFTDAGTVRVDVMQHGSNGHQVTDFAIADSGRGISSADQDKLFQAFERLSDPHVLRQEGTGLGLSICSKLARLLGARILLESEVGKGSTFTLRFEDQAAT